MASTHDSAGRPIVVVTGMGIVTSLGTGKDENWANLTAGKSGIREITPLRHRGPQDPDRRHRRFRARGAVLQPGSVRAAGRTGGRRGNRGVRHRPARRFSRAAVSRRAADRNRMAAAHANWRRPPAPTTRVELQRPAARRRQRPVRPAITTASCSASVADRIAETFGTKGSPISLSTACASGATAIQLGVEAIRRGETDAALCIGTDGSINPESLIRFSLLSALSTTNDPPQARRQALRQEPRRLRHGRRRRRAGAGKPRRRQGARRQNPRRARRLRRDGGRLPPHPLEPGRQADHRLHPQRHRRRRLDARRYRLRQSARHRHARERQDGGLGVDGGVRRARQDAADLVEQVDDRAYAVGRRRGRGGVLAADARNTSASRRPSTTRCPIRRFRSTWCRTRRATPRCGTSSPTRSASAARTCRW